VINTLALFLVFLAYLVATLFKNDGIKMDRLVFHLSTGWCFIRIQIGVLLVYRLVFHSYTDWCVTCLQVGVSLVSRSVCYLSTGWCFASIQVGLVRV